MGGSGGVGGGQIQITAGAFIIIAGQVNVTGGFGAPGGSGGIDGTKNGGGGGGGGAGGNLYLEAPTVEFTNSGSMNGSLCVSVLGGAGGMGGGATMPGNPAMTRMGCPFGSLPAGAITPPAGAGGDTEASMLGGKAGMLKGGSGGGAGSPGKVMVRADTAPGTDGVHPTNALQIAGPYTAP